MRRVLAVAAVAALALTGCSAASSPDHSAHSHAVASELNDNPGTGKYMGFGLDPAQPRPNFTLTDTTGKSVQFAAATRGRPTLVFFGYTHCPDECPTTMADMALAIASVPSAVRARTVVVFVTTDPKRDTGPVIAKWLSQYQRMAGGGTYLGLTGTQGQIDAAQAAAHIPIATDDGETHSTSVLLYGPDDYAHVQFALSDDEQKQIAHDLPIVAASG